MNRTQELWWCRVALSVGSVGLALMALVGVAQFDLLSSPSQSIRRIRALYTATYTFKEVEEGAFVIKCHDLQWYSRTTTPPYPEEYRTWSDAVNFCTAQGQRLCRREEYCGSGPGNDPAGGTKDAGVHPDQWSPAIDAQQMWLMVGLHGGDASKTCKTHEEAFGNSVDDAWATGNDIAYFEWIACCSLEKSAA